MDIKNDETQRQALSPDQHPESSNYPQIIPPDIFPKENPPRPKKWRGCLLLVGGLLALAAVYFTIIYAYNTRSATPDTVVQATETTARILLATLNNPPTKQATAEVLPTEEVVSTPLEPTGDMAVVRFIDGEVFKSVDGSSVPLVLKEGLLSPTSLTANPGSGVYIEYADASDSLSFLYLFFDSTMNLVYDTAFNPDLLSGRLYLQSGLEEAAIHFPEQSNALAILKGRGETDDPSRMLVEIIGNDIWIWCLHGSCYLQNERGDSTPLPVMTKSLYHAATDTLELALPITVEELWGWQVACAYRCLTGFATRPVPTATITPTGLATPTLKPFSTFDPTSTRLPPTPTPTFDPYPPPGPTPLPYPYP